MVRNVTSSSPGLYPILLSVLFTFYSLLYQFTLLFCILVICTGQKPIETRRIKKGNSPFKNRKKGLQKTISTDQSKSYFELILVGFHTFHNLQFFLQCNFCFIVCSFNKPFSKQYTSQRTFSKNHDSFLSPIASKWKEKTIILC